MSDLRGKFIVVGNNLALDFVNTAVVEAGAPVDLLQSEADLGEWAHAVEAGVMPPSRPGGRLDPFVRRLRSALRELFEAVIDGKAPPKEALSELNAALTVPRREPPLAYVRGAFERAQRAEVASVRLLLQRIAHEAATLLEEGDPSLLRRCANGACVLLFCDTTKNHKRRWCSMELCGNRAKVAAFLERSRSES